MAIAFLGYVSSPKLLEVNLPFGFYSLKLILVLFFTYKPFKIKKLKK